jgi:hypothetical protein
MFETALDQESEALLGTFGEITLDKKISATVSLTPPSLKIWKKMFRLLVTNKRKQMFTLI